jgi:ribose/xylose/arabinose/galactoside ABC-type transport system permease subunit
VAALALTLLNQMLLILGLSVGWQFIVFGAAIIVGMLISGDRVASLLGSMMRPKDIPARIANGVHETTS